MALFENTKTDVKEYLALLDTERNMIAVVNPTAKGVTPAMLAEAMEAKGLIVEIRESKPEMRTISL